MLRCAPVFFVVAATVAFADDKPPAEKAKPPAGEDAITAAAHDFQRLKAEPGVPAEQRGLGLPGLVAPELQLGGPTTAVASHLPEKPGAKKSANWLVDGVMKKSEPGSRDKSPQTRAQSFDPASRDGDQKPDEVSTDREKANQEKTDPDERAKAAGPELNPLTRYMAGWMTAQDYTLLRPGLSGDVAADATSRGDPSLMAFGSGSSGDGAKDSLLGISSSQGVPALATSAPRENPFLQAFALPSQPVPAFSQPPVAEPSIGSSGRLVAPAEPPPPERVKVPEIAKPSDDTKYFKQLKRF